MRDQNEQCPEDDFELGTPKGTCWGDGHYTCDECKHFRQDFTGDEGKEKRDTLIRFQIGGIHIDVWNSEAVIGQEVKPRFKKMTT